MSDRPIQSSAPGKAILFGEHAVVYGQPAIAVPVLEVAARAVIVPAPTGAGLSLVATDLEERLRLKDAPPWEPLAFAVRHALRHLGEPEPDATIVIRSSIPIAGGLGSGAAVSAAIVRALASFLGHSLSREEVSRLVFEVEKIHHGTPSGIDNTVIAFEQPVYFVGRESARPELLSVGAPFTLLIVDSGRPSPTKRLVSRVRGDWHRDPDGLGALFRQIGAVVREARGHIESGDAGALGLLMDENHRLLIELGVSSPTLDRLVQVAKAAGASGAKLSGAGGGGCIVALIETDGSDAIKALRKAGAARVIQTTVE